MSPTIDTRDPRFEMLPREFVILRLEVGKHPELEEKLKECTDLAEWFAAVALYAGVAVDGWFEPRDLMSLTFHLTSKLREKRHGITLLY